MHTYTKDDKIKKRKGAKNSRHKRITTTEKNETTNKAVAYDITKADSISNGIIDIVQSPDVAVWSKGIMKKIDTPADKVQQPFLIKSMTTTNIHYGEDKEKQIHIQENVDPANKEDVDKATGSGTSLTDKPTSFIQEDKKEPSLRE